MTLKIGSKVRFLSYQVPIIAGHGCGEVLEFKSGYICVTQLYEPGLIGPNIGFFGAEELEEISEDEYAAYCLLKA